MSDQPRGLKVIKATYGTAEHLEDVTKVVEKLVSDKGALSFNVNPNAFGILDPAPGIKKTFQANISINGGNPTLMTKEDGEQFVVNVPNPNPPKPDNTAGGAIQQILWYSLVSLIGTYFAVSYYIVGASLIGSSIVGIILALLMASSTITFALTSSSLGVAALLPFFLGSFIVQLFLVFAVSLYDPNWLNFDLLKIS
jgi:hypothetical protein|uniref:Uncharacterized protein n=1 Tax=viral metagenome TaxID=1070528 RepID=A0A6C0CSV0_9ZZZZ